MKGSSKLMKQFFDEHGRPPVPLTGKIDWHMFSEQDKKWFFARGCTWHKGERRQKRTTSDDSERRLTRSPHTALGSVRRAGGPDPVAVRHNAPGHAAITRGQGHARDRVCLHVPC